MSNKLSARKSREKLELVIARLSIYDKYSLIIFNLPKDWDTINQYCNAVFPYHVNNIEKTGKSTDKVSLSEIVHTVTPMKKSTETKTSY